jgi:hypothetical protein
MRNHRDLTLHVFGKLVVLHRSEKQKHDPNGYAYWTAHCECGSVRDYSSHGLKYRQSCGCRRSKDETGKRYGRLVVIMRDGKIDKGTAWLCKCDCGTEVRVKGQYLRRGENRSCGCLRKELALVNLKRANESRTLERRAA